MQAEAQSKVTCVQIENIILHDLQSCIHPPVKIPIIFLNPRLRGFLCYLLHLKVGIVI